eukprot:scaffold648304_cov39-Prasinocladus_malaysianus.AAC.1
MLCFATGVPSSGGQPMERYVCRFRDCWVVDLRPSSSYEMVVVAIQATMTLRPQAQRVPASRLPSQ